MARSKEEKRKRKELVVKSLVVFFNDAVESREKQGFGWETAMQDTDRFVRGLITKNRAERGFYLDCLVEFKDQIKNGRV